MIKVEIHYATKSAKHPRFVKEMEFNDEKHLENYIAKAEREGKKITGWVNLSDPCVWILYYEKLPEHINPLNIPIKAFMEFGEKMSILDFEKELNLGPYISEYDFNNYYIKFQNIEKHGK